jgi:hypothetical protein
MARLHLRGVIAVLVCVAALAGSSGCAWFNKSQGMQITIMVPGDQMLFMAVIPRLLPDGTVSTEKKAALLKDVAARAGRYTLAEEQVGAWVPAAGKEAVKEVNDVLWVAGTPALGLYLYEKLRDDFNQQEPFVIAIPLQAPIALGPREFARMAAAQQAAVQQAAAQESAGEAPEPAADE